MSALVQKTTLPRFAATLVGGILLSGVLAASAHASVPFWPVPMTLQPLAVLVISGLLGPRLAVAAFVAYLAEGAVGLPVFAGTPMHGVGLAYMAGPTGGYLAGQLVASFLVGTLIARFGLGAVAVFGAMVAGMVAIYACGVAWLSGFVSGGALFAAGVAPFLLGDLVKIGIATGLVLALKRARA